MLIPYQLTPGLSLLIWVCPQPSTHNVSRAVDNDRVFHPADDRIRLGCSSCAPLVVLMTA